MTKRPIKDSDGKEIRAGDSVHFSYGIPPIRVDASVVERSGELIALCPGHNPPQCLVRDLKKNVDVFYRVERRAADPKEVEANIFAKRTSRA